MAEELLVHLTTTNPYLTIGSTRTPRTPWGQWVTWRQRRSWTPWLPGTTGRERPSGGLKQTLNHVSVVVVLLIRDHQDQVESQVSLVVMEIL